MRQSPRAPVHDRSNRLTTIALSVLILAYPNPQLGFRRQGPVQDAQPDEQRIGLGAYGKNEIAAIAAR